MVRHRSSDLRRGRDRSAPAPRRSARGIRQLEVLDSHHRRVPASARRQPRRTSARRSTEQEAGCTHPACRLGDTELRRPYDGETPRSRRSAIQTLMIDWRSTPRRRASRSSDSIIHAGKSTFTRRCSRPGGRAADMSQLGRHVPGGIASRISPRPGPSCSVSFRSVPGPTAVAVAHLRVKARQTPHVEPHTWETEWLSPSQ